MLLALKILCLAIWIFIIFLLAIASESGRTLLSRPPLTFREVHRRERPTNKRKITMPRKTAQ